MAKARVAKAAPPGKAGIAKAKAPVAKAPVAKAPVAKASVAKAPVAKASVAKAPVTKASTAKAPVTKAKAPVSKAAPAAAASPEANSASQVSSAHAAAPRTDTWRDFEDSDPMYALMGEMAQDKIFGPDGNVKPATLDRYLHKLFVQKVIKKPKDWVEIWAAMDVPVESQTQVLEPLLRYGLKHAPQGLGRILAELLKGHRVKTKTIEESVLGAFKDDDDECMNLTEFLYLVFPRGAASPWGWSRIGWSWQQWWTLLDRTVSALKGSAAFDSLAALLDRIEAEGGTELAKQEQIWNEKRLGMARTLLCKFGGLEGSEGDLVACLDAVLL